MRITVLVISLFILTCSVASADEVTIPNTFDNGTVANADDVNANFAALVAESNENDTRLGVLEDGKFLTSFISLSNNDAGTQNTLFGSNAGFNIIVDGNWNSAFGHEALYSSTTGKLNTAIGYQTLYSTPLASAILA